MLFIDLMSFVCPVASGHGFITVCQS